jgi:hypothetical protein
VDLNAAFHLLRALIPSSNHGLRVGITIRRGDACLAADVIASRSATAWWLNERK